MPTSVATVFEVGGHPPPWDWVIASDWKQVLSSEYVSRLMFSADTEA